MELKDIAEPALVFAPEDLVSKVASEMFRKRRHEALVFEGKEYLGMFTARDLTKRKINDPDKVKVGHLKAIIKKITPFSPEAGLKEVADAMLINSYRSVPLKLGEDYSIITKLGLLRLLPKDVLKGKVARDVMSFPYCVSTNDSLAVARSILRQMGITNLVVINERDRADGIIETLDLLRTVIDKVRPARGDLAEEKINLGDVLASSPSIKQGVFVKVTPDTPLKEVVERMLKAGSAVAVVEDEKFQGIITPAFILKLLSKEVSGIYVRVTGQQGEDDFIKSVIDEEIKNEIRKLAKILPIDYFVINIDKHSAAGRRAKYSLKARLISQKGMFFTKAHAWDLTKAMHELLDRLERDVKKQKEKARVFRRGRVDHFTWGRY